MKSNKKILQYRPPWVFKNEKINRLINELKKINTYVHITTDGLQVETEETLHTKRDVEKIKYILEQIQNTQDAVCIIEELTDIRRICGIINDGQKTRFLDWNEDIIIYILKEFPELTYWRPY